MDLFSTGLDETKLIAQRRNRILLWAYDANSGCQFLSGKYWKLFLKNDEAVILVNSLLQKKGRLVWRYF
jgi:heterodisulfide reductase subunit B